QERRLRRTRRILAAAAVLVAAFAALSAALFFKEREARAQQAAAERARIEARNQQTAAEGARNEATRSRDQTRATLSQSDFLKALRSINEDKGRDALAQLARSLVFDRTNQAASCRLATLLTYSNYAIALVSLKHLQLVLGAKFSPDGKR